MSARGDEAALKAAIESVNIQAPGKPYELDADFVAQVNVPQKGHYHLKWVSAKQWSMETTMGNYKEFVVRKEDVVYTQRNLGFTPLRVAQVHELMTVFKTSTGWQYKKSKGAGPSGKLECAELRYRAPKENKAKEEVCFDAATHDIRSVTYTFIDETDVHEFADYQEMLGHRFPRSLKSLESGITLLNVNVTSLAPTKFTIADIVPPAGAEERRQCDDQIKPVPLKTPDPEYPHGASSNNLAGRASVWMTVKTDGSVDNIRLIESAGHDMDKSTQDALKTWKFKPAMCGLEPIETDIRVEVTFRIR
jgi:protein TonB